MSRERVLDLVTNGKRFLVTCHLRPDADALGSALGWAAILRALGKEAVVFTADTPPEMLGFFPGIDAILHEVPPGAFDASFVMDAAAKPLVPQLPRDRTGPLVMMDHHSAHDEFGDVILREPDACATGEVVLRMMRLLGVDRIPSEAATPLYAAIVADTGGFRYPGTKPSTLRLGAELLEAGAEPWKVAYRLFEDFRPERMKLLGAVIGSMHVEEQGRIAVLYVTRKMLAECGANDEMVEGMVNYGRMLRGVEVSVLLWELESKTGPVTKISLRSTGSADVSSIALALKGGGHRSAAGANVPEPIDRAREIVIELARKTLPT
jgi:phosphoesterase RecJ-like protein